ncbi:hypothetical protein RclHR1_04990003 [Rhizophagus clarus]|nr:hypothetical protein RclHR1_04990003 [Rhizophagus clarus]
MKQQITEISTTDAGRTRRSARIQERALDVSSNNTTVVSHKATISDRLRPKRATRSTSTKKISEKDNPANKSTNTKRSKKYKITSQRPQQAIVQEALVASLVVIQNTTVPRVTKCDK